MYLNYKERRNRYEVCKSNWKNTWIRSAAESMHMQVTEAMMMVVFIVAVAVVAKESIVQVTE